MPKSPEGNSSNLKSNKYTDNDNTELQTELKVSTNEEVVLKKFNIENSNQSKKLSPKRPLKKRSSTRITISRTNKVPESKKNKPIESEDEKDSSDSTEFDSESEDSSKSSQPGNKNLVFDTIEIIKTNCNQVNFNLIFNFHNSSENTKKKIDPICIIHALIENHENSFAGIQEFKLNAFGYQGNETIRQYFKDLVSFSNKNLQFLIQKERSI